MRIYTTPPGLRIISKLTTLLKTEQFSCIKTNTRWIYDKTNVYNQLDKWSQNIPWIKPFYAVKSNPSQHLIKDIVSHPYKVGLDVASLAEIELAQQNTSTCNTIYTNPHTMNHAVDKYKTMPMNIKVIDSIGELKKMSHMNPLPKILIRINGGNTRGDTNFDTKFGANHEETIQILAYAKKNQLPICGVSFHIGSGGTYNRREAYMNAYQTAAPYLETLAVPMPILNFGGGMLPNTDLKDVLGWTSRLPYQLIAEPGRYISGPSHHLLTQVIAVTRRGIYLDNGVYHELNCYTRDHWHFPELTMCADINPSIGNTCSYQSFHSTVVDATYTTKIFGPTCDSDDMIPDCRMPNHIEEGDWILLPNMGAYTTAGMVEFNGIEGASSVEPVHI